MDKFCYLAGMFVVAQIMLLFCGCSDDNKVTEQGLVNILFEARSVVVMNPYEGKGVNITVRGADVVIHSDIQNEITYILSGSTADGSLKIYSDTKFELKMNGVHIMKSNDPALNIQTGGKAMVTLVDGTSNKLTGGTTFISEGGDEDIKAAFFSEGQLVFAGTGSLIVAAPYRHAICSDDYICIDGGSITVSQAEKDGFHANDYIEINGGTIEIISVGDGIESEGYITLTGGYLKITTTGRKAHGMKSAAATTIHTAGTIDIKAEGAGSKAFNCGEDLLVSQGNIRLVTSGNAFYDTEVSDISSAAGIKCDGDFTFNGGDLVISSSGSGGKGINTVGKITLEGGEITVTTTGEVFRYGEDDSAAKAIKCDGDMIVGDCSLTIKTSGRKAEGLECEANMTINAGVVEVEAYDDAIKAAKSIIINGGAVYGYSETKGGIYSKGALSVAGGTVVAVGSSDPESGFVCSDVFKITGGTLLGIGSTMSIPASDVCTQYSLLYSSGKGHTQYSLLNISSSDGKHIMTYRLPCAFSRMALLFGSPELTNNTSYTLSSGGSVSGGSAFHDLYNDATYTGGSPLSTFAISSMITTVTE
jgi:hypothetical protein